MRLIITTAYWLTAILFLHTQASLSIKMQLPQLKQHLQSAATRKHIISDNQTFIHMISPQASIISKLQQNCHIHDAYISIKELSTYPINTKHIKYLFHHKYNQIYELQNDQLIIYKIKNYRKFHLQQKGRYQLSNSCHSDMIIHHSSQLLILYSCQDITFVHFQGDKQLQTHSNNHAYSKLYVYDQLLIINHRKQVQIYGIGLNRKLNRLNLIHSDKKLSLEIVDVHYSNQRLFLVDKKLGVLIYTKIKHQFLQNNRIQLNIEQQIDYNKILQWNSNLYLSISSESESLVVQYLYLRDANYLQLIRYYNGFADIINIEIIQDHLIIQTQTKIQSFFINRDPRLIKTKHNSYTYSHYNLQSFQYLYDRFYMFVTYNSITFVQWSYNDKKLQCQFQHLGIFYIQLQYPCRINNNLQFYKECTKRQILQIQKVHRDDYIWLLLIISGVFIIAVMLLIYWRQLKMNRIQFLLRRMKQIKMKYKMGKISAQSIGMNGNGNRKEMFNEQNVSKIKKQLFNNETNSNEQQMQRYNTQHDNNQIRDNEVLQQPKSSQRNHLV